MRHILVDRARGKARIKHGGGRQRVNLDELEVAVEPPGDELLALNEVLGCFEAEYPWEHRIVTLRFFAGLTNEETAQAISAPLRTVERDCRFARAWLHDALRSETK